MAIDVLTFLTLIRENTEDSLGNPGVDAVKHEEEQRSEKEQEKKMTEKELRDAERQRKINEARSAHENKMRKVLLKAGFVENNSATKLKKDEFSFFDRDTTKDKPDLEVNFEGKPVKIELKAKHPESEHQKQAGYTLRYDKEIEFPIKNEQGIVVDRMKISPSEFYKHQRTMEQGIEYDPDVDPAEIVKQVASGSSRLYGLTFENLAKLFTAYGTRFSADIFKRQFDSLLRHIGWNKKRKEKIGRSALTEMIPSVLHSTGSHFSVVGNDLGVHLVHHRNREDPDRPHVDKFLQRIGMRATHEPEEVHFARSPEVDPKLGESRGGGGLMGISLSPTKHPFFIGKQNKQAKDELLQRIADAFNLNTETYKNA